MPVLARRLARHTFSAVAAGCLTAALVAAPAAAQLRDGFRSTLVERGDDNWSGFQSLGFSLNIRGGTYEDASACTNGYISLLLADDPNNCRFFSTELSELAAANGATVAPFWDDLITTENFGVTPGQVGYGAGTVGGRSAFGFTWDGVRTLGTPFLSYFQVVFVDRGDRAVGDFDLEYNYGTLDGLNPFVVAGFAEDGSFTGEPYLVGVTPEENSRVVQCFVGGSIGTCAVIPEPATLALTLSGAGVLAAAAAARRRRPC